MAGASQFERTNPQAKRLEPTELQTKTLVEQGLDAAYGVNTVTALVTRGTISVEVMPKCGTLLVETMPKFNALVARETSLVARDTSLDARGTFSVEAMPQLAALLARSTEFTALVAYGMLSFEVMKKFTALVVFETREA
jgi:hypothetical protein